MMAPSGDAGARAPARASSRLSPSLASVVLVALATVMCVTNTFGSGLAAEELRASAFAAAREDPSEVMGSNLRRKVATRRLLYLNSNGPSNDTRPGVTAVFEGVTGVFDLLSTLPTAAPPQAASPRAPARVGLIEDFKSRMKEMTAPKKEEKAPAKKEERSPPKEEVDPIMTRVKVDLDFAVYEERPLYYQNLFKEEVASALGIDKERVIIANVYEGSVIFEFYIANDPDLLAARSFQTKIEEKGRVCVSYASILDVRICKDGACEDGWEDRSITTRVKVDLDFAVYEQRPVYFNDLFKEEVATTLIIDKERAVIVNVYDDGSTIFETYMTNDPDFVLAKSLQAKIEEKGKMCLGYSIVEDVRICKDDACKDPITTRVKVDLDFDEYKRRSEHYNNLFKEEVAVALRIEKGRVVIVDVYEDGSTIFESYVENDPDLAVAKKLQDKIENGSMTISQARVLQAVICKDGACTYGWGDPIQLIREG